MGGKSSHASYRLTRKSNETRISFNRSPPVQAKLNNGSVAGGRGAVVQESTERQSSSGKIVYVMMYLPVGTLDESMRMANSKWGQPDHTRTRIASALLHKVG